MCTKKIKNRVNQTNLFFKTKNVKLLNNIQQIYQMYKLISK